jgi:hypothetical protein
MPSLTSEERQMLDDSIQGYLTDHYNFEHWRTHARASTLGYAPMPISVGLE